MPLDQKLRQLVIIHRATELLVTAKDDNSGAQLVVCGTCQKAYVVAASTELLIRINKMPFHVASNPVTVKSRNSSSKLEEL